MAQDDRCRVNDRRSFLKWAIHGLGALFTAILGIPAILYLIDARNRPGQNRGFRLVDGIKISELPSGQPRQGVIRDIRTDAWTLHPNDVVGRVWVLKGDGDDDLKVWTTICPHLGCSINWDAGGFFACPCHGAEFTPGGECVNRAGYNNPAPRGMDTLQWQRAKDPANPDPGNRDLLLVNYQNFYQARPDKVPKA